MSNSIYPATSPYYLTDISTDKYLDILRYRSIPKLASDVLYIVPKVYEFRPDMLAYDLYNNPKLWWVFASRNPNTLADPFFDFITGTSIYLPENSTLISVLGL